MPLQWPEEIYDYEASKLVHVDLEAVDLEAGIWFKCKYCKNQKDVGSFLVGIAFTKSRDIG